MNDPAIPYFLGGTIVLMISLLAIRAAAQRQLRTSHFETIRLNQEIIRGMFDPARFRADHIRCAWPRKPNGVPALAFAYDRGARRLILLYTEADSRWYALELTPADIHAISLLEDTETVAQVSRPAQLGGALAGGILAGAPGLVVGGRSSKTSSQAQRTRVGLVIPMRLAGRDSTLDFCIWDGTQRGGWAALDSPGQRAMVAEGRRWFEFVREFMDSVRNDQENRGSVVP